MLNKLRVFSNTKIAGILVGIIIIPFVLWGMGSVFSGGNTNNVAKINNKSISTKDFVEHINNSRLNNEVIRANLDKNILEKILSDLVSRKLLDMEINDLGVLFPEKSLIKSIKSNNTFHDEKNIFSRLKYEKFLLENNLTAPDFEIKLKQRLLKKNLFNYISGGIKSPYFLNNIIFIDETKKVELEYFNLNKIYNTEVNDLEIDIFIKDNLENLKEDLIDFNYIKITPKSLVEIEEFNDEYFKKIDEIENSILNGENINKIKNNYNLNLISKNNYKIHEKDDEILKEIYSNRNGNKTQLIDKNDFFLLFEINKIKKILPSKKDVAFINKVKEMMIMKRKFDLHQEIFKKIQDKKLKDDDFLKISKNSNNVENILINGLVDNSKFDSESIKLIYSLPKESFILVTDDGKNIYLGKIKNIYSKKLGRDDKSKNEYYIKSNENIINNIYTSYDFSLNEKYKVKIFNNTIDRVKNYFR